MNPKIIAMYLPQFHCIPENDEFWGNGFTDWVTVKNARPLFKGHIQPKVPLNNNYYDLSLKDDVAWQTRLAKEYGIDGFGIYHYWFNNEKNLLTKPAEIIRDNNDIDINYFFAWDNISWKRSWSNVEGNAWAPAVDAHEGQTGPQILIPYVVGGQMDWKKHYDYLRSYFMDERYEKYKNRPLFVIFHYSLEIKQMCEYWDYLAKEDGFDGMFFVFRYDKKYNIPLSENVFRYEPQFSGWVAPCLYDRIYNKFINLFSRKGTGRRFSYDIIWKNILRRAKNNSRKNLLYGAFVSYDDTPRRGGRGTIVQNATPQKFTKYLKELLQVSQLQNKEYLFLTAWNEWGEGACFEPDEVNGYDYLMALRKVKSEI